VSEAKVEGDIDAVLLFVDIVDSSKFSSVLGFQEYAKRLLDFQRIFRTLGRRYFPEPEDDTIGYCSVTARGDEGTVFCIEKDFEKRAALVFRAIEFVYHLKGIMYFGPGDSKVSTKKEDAPLRMKIGAGIHFGKVVYSTKISENHRKKISQIDGYSINKAKRIESSSRQGVYSGIVLSKEAAKLLDGEPIIFSPFVASMKGIEDNAKLYEVQSGYLSNLEVIKNDVWNELLIQGVRELANDPDKIDEEWLKALIISVLDVKLERAISGKLKKDYGEEQAKLTSHNINESDPILLYKRAINYQQEGEYTQQLRYLKQLLEQHPDFLHAKIKLIEACWEIAKKAKERSEKTYARDVAEELINKFSQFLTEEEIKKLSCIVQTARKIA